jgi:peptide/nickel transport system permease protein
MGRSLHFAAARLLFFSLTLVAASIVIFLALSVLPGDPAAIVLGEASTPEDLARVRAAMGLDRPLAVQYLEWVTGLLQGDLGTSFISQVPVSEQIVSRLGVTVPLAVGAIVLSLVIAVPCGLFAARRNGTTADVTVSAISQVGLSIPVFWFGVMLIAVFSVSLGWFPFGGFTPWSESPAQAVRSLALPVVSLAVVYGSILTRYVRSAVVEVMSEDYIRTARAKGLTVGRALRVHGLKNAAIPVVTVTGLEFAGMLAGTVIIETVFTLPGIGRLMVAAVSARDLLALQGVLMVITATILLVNLIVDLSYLVLDPKLRRG